MALYFNSEVYFMKKIFSVAMLIVCLSLVVVLFTACGDKDNTDTTTTAPTTEGVSYEDATIDIEGLTGNSTSAEDSQAADTTKAPAKPSGSSSSSSSSTQSTNPPKTTAAATTKPASSNSSSGDVQLATGSIYDNWY